MNLSKGIYVGVDGKARKVKKAYIGVDSVLSNLLVNADFSDGINNWASSISQISPTVIEENGEKILVNTVTSIVSYSDYRRGGSYQSFNQPSGEHIYYASIYYKGKSTNTSTDGVRLVMGSASFTNEMSEALPSTQNDWKLLSMYGSFGDSSKFSLYGDTGKTATVGNQYFYKQPKLYDLTAFFGAGNEPTKEWCDENIANINEYVVKNKARKIKKGYIGVGGIARQFYSSEKIISFYGSVSDLSTARSYLAATSIGNYALFGGGSGNTATVDTYTSTLSKSTAANLSTGRYSLAATSIGNYALFGGGHNGSAVQTTVDTYTSTLAKGTATKLSTGRPYLKATTVGNYALFGGGGADYKSSTSTVDTYTSTLAKGTATNLTSAANYLAATSIGDYALFAGGRTGSADSTSLTTVNTYTSSLAKGTATSLTTARYNLAATTAGDYALFAGGENGSTLSIVDTYNSSLVKGTTTNLSVVGQHVAATTLGGFAIFAGGHNNDAGNATNAINIYSANLTHTVSEGTLSARKYNVAATSIGNYAIFAGGGFVSNYANADACELIE